MVTKTRRKRSAATRVKTADASKLRTRKRSKRSKRRRCRTAKRGGMIRSSRSAAALAAPLLRKGPQGPRGPRVFQNIITGRDPRPEDGALVVNGMRYFGSTSDMPSPSFSDRFRKDYEDKTTDPTEVLSVADTAFSAAHKGLYNGNRRDKLKNQTPARPHNLPLLVTPQRNRNGFHPEQLPSPMYKLETPANSSTERSSPPPLSVVGTASPLYTDSREFKQSFATTHAKPSPDKTIRRLKYE